MISHEVAVAMLSEAMLLAMLLAMILAMLLAMLQAMLLALLLAILLAMLRKTKSCLISIQWIPKTTGEDLVKKKIGGKKIVSSVNKKCFQNSHQRKASH